MDRNGMIERLLFRKITLFEVAFFGVASLIYWTYLTCLWQGLVSDAGVRDWYAAIGGSIFFPLMCALAWWERRRARLAEAFAATLPRPLLSEWAVFQHQGGTRKQWRSKRMAQLTESLVRKVDPSEAEAIVRGESPRPAGWIPADECDWDDFQDFLA